jgi:UDP-2,3-diacylglucosamine hydrolase
VSQQKRLGVIAGSGEIPLYVCSRAKQDGYTCIVVGIQDEFNKRIKNQADMFVSRNVKDFLEIILFFKEKNVNKILLAGKIRHQNMYPKEAFPPKLSSLLEGTKDRSPEEITRAVFHYIENQGIKIMDPSLFLSGFFCEEGILTRKSLSPVLKGDIDYGWPVAKQIADLDIGQTVVIKNKAVVAVEGMEGTDRTIIRGGSIAGKGCVVIKVARSHQDIKIDQPAVGLRTIQSLKKARCSALCIEAHKVLFIDKEKALNHAEQNGISIIARR